MIRINRTCLIVLSLVVAYGRPVLADRWKHFLPFENVVTVQYDSLTHIYWFGTTTSGTWRFDGREFEPLSFPKDTLGITKNVTALAIDEKKGELWVGTIHGLFRYHIESETCEYYNSQSGLSRNHVTALFVDAHGTLWYGSESNDGVEGGGVGKMDSTGWFRYTTDGYAKWDSGSLRWVGIDGAGPSSNFIDCIVQDDEENMYFGTREAGLCIRFSAGTWECLAPFRSALNRVVKAIAIDRGGNKWLGTLAGVCVLDKGNNPVYQNCFTPQNTDSGLINSFVHAIWIESFQNGDIKWFATSGGVSMLDSTNQRWKAFTNESSGLATNQVKDITGDNDGNLWFASLDFGGVSKLNNKWADLTTQDGLASNLTRAVEKDKLGRLWIGTNQRGRVDIVHGGASKRLELDDGACEYIPLTRDFLGDASEMWVATIGCGLFRVSRDLVIVDKIRVNEVPEFPSNNILALAVHDRTLWAGTDKGLVRVLISDAALIVDRVFNTRNSPLPGDSVFALAWDQHNALWVGTNRGIRIFDGTSWSDPKFSENTVINAVARDSSDFMWVGTNNGVARFDGAKWTSFSTVDLPDDIITSIAVAPDGAVWCGTPKGAAVFSEEVWTAYTTDDGLSDDHILDIAFGPEDVVWFATWGGGICRYRKTRVHPETILLDPLDIVAHSNINFRYSGYDLNTPTENLRYQYALDNPSDWSPITPASFATLTVDTDGLHTFYVRAIDKDGNLDGSPAKFRFHKIRPEQGGAAAIIDSARVHEFGSLWLYVPPNVLKSATSLNATPVDPDSIAVDDEKLRFTGIAYHLGPADAIVTHKKPMTMTIFYGDSVAAKFDEPQLAIYQNNNKGTWTLIGGAIDRGRRAITTTISQLGTFALFTTPDAADDEPFFGIRNVAAQPRIFSPQSGGFHETVTVSFDLGEPGEVTAKVYNLAGRRIRVLCENLAMNRGRNAIDWDGRDYNAAVCSSGLYVVTIQAAGRVATKQVMVLNENKIP